MLVETLYDLPYISGRAGIAEPAEPYDFETVVHAGDQEVVLARGRWMPLYTPGAAPNVGLDKRGERLADVE